MHKDDTNPTELEVNYKKYRGEAEAIFFSIKDVIDAFESGRRKFEHEQSRDELEGTLKKVYQRIKHNNEWISRREDEQS